MRRILLAIDQREAPRAQLPREVRQCDLRGIVQPDGTAEFCEVFFTDARCPKDNVVGGVNNGWKVANSTLA